MSVKIYTGDALTVLRTLESESVQACICSPPYALLRSYLPADHPDKAKEIGSSVTPSASSSRRPTSDSRSNGSEAMQAPCSRKSRWPDDQALGVPDDARGLRWRIYQWLALSVAQGRVLLMSARLTKRAVQRQPGKRPHKPTSQRLGPRRLTASLTRGKGAGRQP